MKALTNVFEQCWRCFCSEMNMIIEIPLVYLKKNQKCQSKMGKNKMN